MTGAASAAALVHKQHQRGTHRVVTPERTLARVWPLAPILGVTRLANVTGLDTLGIPVYVCSRPNARSLSVSQGKGIDPVAAKVSALMESVETYHAERVLLPLKLASQDELRFTHPLIDVDALPLRKMSGFHSGARILWVEGRELRQQRPLWVPFELVHLNYTLPALPGMGYFLGTSNGLASGNHPLEAITHGLCEVIERDAETLWSLSSSSARDARKLRLDSVDDPICRELLARFERADVVVSVYDITSDVGVAAFNCMIASRKREAWGEAAPARGLGCHPTREIALQRALTEAAQSRLTQIAGSRDDLRESSYFAERGDERSKRARALIDESPGQRHFGDIPSQFSETLEADVAWLTQRLEDVGLGEVVVVDLTRPEFKIPVVRVIVPGLEAFHSVPGFVPGRRATRLIQEHQA